MQQLMPPSPTSRQSASSTCCVTYQFCPLDLTEMNRHEDRKGQLSMLRTSQNSSHRHRGLVPFVCLLLVALAVSLNSAASAGAHSAFATITTRTASAQAPTSQPKPTIVLVHGAWADGSSWSRVARGLQRDGYTVVAPPNPLRGLSSDSAYLASYLRTLSGPLVLVGHSYGGAVITDAATGNLQVKALVYVDAFIPDTGQSLAQLLSAQPGSCLAGGGNPAKVFSFVPSPGGAVDLYLKSAADAPYPGFASCFANDLPASQAAVLAATQRPLALSATSEPSSAPAWRTIRSWAVIGTIDQVIPPSELLAMAHTAGARVVTVRASHLSLISRPVTVISTIESAASATN